MSLEVSGFSMTVFNGDDTLLVQKFDGGWCQVEWIVDANDSWPLVKSYVLAHNFRQLPEYDVVASVKLPKYLVKDFLSQQRKKTSDVVR